MMQGLSRTRPGALIGSDRYNYYNTNVYAFRYYLQMTQKDKESQRSNENVINLLQKSQFMKHV